MEFKAKLCLTIVVVAMVLFFVVYGLMPVMAKLDAAAATLAK